MPGFRKRIRINQPGVVEQLQAENPANADTDQSPPKWQQPFCTNSVEDEVRHDVSMTSLCSIEQDVVKLVAATEAVAGRSH